MPNVLVYDNACSLRLHWNKVHATKIFQKNEFTDKLYNLQLFIDRFHQKGHTRPMCKSLMNPDHGYNKKVMEDINTSVCEQFFSFLTKFRYSLRGYNYPYSTLFTLLLFHLKNCHTVGVDANAMGLGQIHFSNHIKRHFISQCIFEGIHNDSKPKLINNDDATNNEVDSDGDENIIMETDHVNFDDDDSNFDYDD